VRKIRLRTKFLLSLLVVTAGLTSAALLIVRYSIQNQVRQAIREDLRNSVNTYRSFDRQREETLTRSAALLANLPNLRALMTTRNVETIQDGAEDVWRLSGSDLLVLADRAANVVAIRTRADGLERGAAEQLLRHSLEQGEQQGWWFWGGHLYEVWMQPIYFGEPSQNTTLGLLAVGHEVNERVAKELSDPALPAEVLSPFLSFDNSDRLAASEQWQINIIVYPLSRPRDGLLIADRVVNNCRPIIEDFLRRIGVEKAFNLTCLIHDFGAGWMTEGLRGYFGLA